MLRTLALLAVTACAVSPALADHTQAHRDSRSGVRDHAMVMGTRETTISTYGLQDRKLDDRFYRYYLTPREFVRLRAQGLTTDEVFMVANAAQATGMDPQIFAQALFRGETPRQISIEWGIDPKRLTAVVPEWRTQEWANATGQPVYTRDRLNVWW